MRTLPLTAMALALPILVTGCGESPGENTSSASGSGGASAASGSGSTASGTTGSGQAPSCVGTRDQAITLAIQSIDPQATDPAIRAGDPSHLWVEPVAPAAGKLFVFLPGTGGPPAGYRHILRNAAAGGYHSIGLAYVNDQAVNTLCTASSPPDCQEQVRLEVITGTDTSALVDVDRANSIENRLIKLLEHLQWSQYLNGSELRHADIAFAGHSQGGGHAGMIAKLHGVHRAILFASTEPGAWTLQPHATPAERYFGFVHTADPTVQAFLKSWDNLGMPGAPASVDGSTPPFGGSQRLTTSDPPPDGNAHGAPVVDPSTPFDGNQPRYRDVWCYVIGP